MVAGLFERRACIRFRASPSLLNLQEHNFEFQIKKYHLLERFSELLHSLDSFSIPAFSLWAVVRFSLGGRGGGSWQSRSRPTVIEPCVTATVPPPTWRSTLAPGGARGAVQESQTGANSAGPLLSFHYHFALRTEQNRFPLAQTGCRWKECDSFS